MEIWKELKHPAGFCIFDKKPKPWLKNFVAIIGRKFAVQIPARPLNDSSQNVTPIFSFKNKAAVFV